MTYADRDSGAGEDEDEDEDEEGVDIGGWKEGRRECSFFFLFFFVFKRFKIQNSKKNSKEFKIGHDAITKKRKKRKIK